MRNCIRLLLVLYGKKQKEGHATVWVRSRKFGLKHAYKAVHFHGIHTMPEKMVNFSHSVSVSQFDLVFSRMN